MDTLQVRILPVPFAVVLLKGGLLATGPAERSQPGADGGARDAADRPEKITEPGWQPRRALAGPVRGWPPSAHASSS
jgi:hypothetical protein